MGSWSWSGSATWAVELFLVVALAACGNDPVNNDSDGAGVRTVADSDASPAFVGAAACGRCHADQLAAWSDSHHDLAMQPANADTVLGDFGAATFDHNGVETSFYIRDGRYYTRTDGPDGVLAEFPVRYTFGVSPLQQYIVELPTGRLQALGVAWDSRAADAGGQRWFHVYGDEPIDHTDVLHWTKLSQNWDSMCAECHSTALTKRFDIDTQRFTTGWSEINVACEACHGPGSAHVAWAGESPAFRRTADNRLPAQFTERREVAWESDPVTGNSRRSRPRTTRIEINTCAPCHSRRSRIADSAVHPGTGFLDYYVPALIEPPLYHIDGQIDDEVYVYGSFLQSKMYQKGVTCADCHEPHSLQLRAEGSQVCLQCHRAQTFRTEAHQLHPADAAEVDCIACHMPEVTYMQVDARHDHSFRNPRPDLSVTHGTPNTCSACHADEGAAWAAGVLRERNRVPAADHWVERLVAARARPWDARDELLDLATDALAPAIVRATAIVGLPLSGDAATTVLIGEHARSSDPMLRWAVARSLQNSHPVAAAEFGPALLTDPVRAVRIAAAAALAPLGLELLPPEVAPDLERAIEEYLAAQRVSAERPEAHINIGNLQRSRNRLEAAEISYRAALRQNADFVPAYVNLSDLYRLQGRDPEGEAVLRTALERLPGQPALHHALGLALVRQGHLPAAISELKLAADAADADPQFTLAYVLALDAQGQSAAAAAYLETALARFGEYPVLVGTLINIYQRMGDQQAAEALAGRTMRSDSDFE